jgi:hypothetical protein
MALSCDACGHVGGVRKRRCPVGYCPAPALCGACNAKFRQDGSWARAHAECPRLHAEYVAEEAEKAAHPEQWARSAFGDWHPDTPKGMVRVITHAGTEVIVPKDAYDPSVPGFGAWPGYTPEAQAYETALRGR